MNYREETLMKVRCASMVDPCIRDARSRMALEVADRFSRGEASAEDMMAAALGARDAVRRATDGAKRAAESANIAMEDAAYSAAQIDIQCAVSGAQRAVEAEIDVYAARAALSVVSLTDTIGDCADICRRLLARTGGGSESVAFKDKLKLMSADEGFIEWVGGRTLKEAWAECQRGDWMLWLAARSPDVDLKTLTMAKVRCARLATAAYSAACAASTDARPSYEAATYAALAVNPRRRKNLDTLGQCADVCRESIPFELITQGVTQ